MKFNVPCPACKKPVANTATACPHCGQVFDAKALQARKTFVQTAGIGCGVLVLLVVILAVLGIVFGEPEAQPDVAKPVETANIAQEPVNAPKTDAVSEESQAARAGAVSMVRAVQMQHVVCKGDFVMAVEALDKMAAGKKPAIEAFEELGRAEKSCQSAQRDMGEFDLSEYSEPQAAAAIKSAIATCKKGMARREKAMAEGKVLMDQGTVSFSTAAAFRDKLRTASADDLACKQDLIGFAGLYNVPEADLDFLN